MRFFLFILFLFSFFLPVFADESGNTNQILETPSSQTAKMAAEMFSADEDEKAAGSMVLEVEEVPDTAKPQNDVMVQSSLEAAEHERETNSPKPEESTGKLEITAPELPEELPEEKETAPKQTRLSEKSGVVQQPIDNSSYENLSSREIAIQKSLKNPRVTVNFFIETLLDDKYDDGILTMDFSAQPGLSKLERHNLAFKLWGILCRLDNFQLNAIPEEYDQDECYLMPDKNYHAIVLTRQPDGTWRFGTATVADIPTFYEKILPKTPNFIRKTWMKCLPEFMFHSYCGMLLIQWVFFLITVCLGFVEAWLLPKICAPITLLFINMVNGRKEYIPFIRRVYSPLAYYTMFIIWYWGLYYACASPVILRNAILVLHPLGIVFLMISLLRAVDVFAFWFRKRLERNQNKTGTVLVDITSGGLKFLVVCIGIILVAEVFGFSALGIISGMGVGGVAVALAAQQTIANFFGSLTILLDRPFTVGDRVVIGSVEGLIESIGVRSTRIRTLYDSSVIIPNATLSTDTIDNLGRRAARRFRTILTVTYDTTPEKLEEFCENIKKILIEDPDVLQDRSTVSIYDFSASSIDILFNSFFRAETSSQEFAIRERLLLKILRLANEMSVEFAFPTQTNYVINQENREI